MELQHIAARISLSHATFACLLLRRSLRVLRLCSLEPPATRHNTSQDGEPNEPITFEVGAGDIMGNALFQAFDEAVRGLVAGDSAVVQAKAGARSRSRGAAATQRWHSAAPPAAQRPRILSLAAPHSTENRIPFARELPPQGSTTRASFSRCRGATRR